MTYNTKNKPLLGEIWNFLKVRKLWWMIPIILLLIMIGTVIIVGSSGGGAGMFIYAMF